MYIKLLAHDKQIYLLPSIGCIHIGASTTKSKLSSFLIKCNSESAFYYLSHYCCLNTVQKATLSLARIVMHAKIVIFKFIEKKK